MRQMLPRAISSQYCGAVLHLQLHLLSSDQWETGCLAICRYLVSLIASDADGVHTDLNEFGLEAMNVALNAGGLGERNSKLIVWNTGVHHQASGPALSRGL